MRFPKIPIDNILVRVAVDAMNDLYRNELRLFMNLFLPSTKLLEKKRIGSQLRRRYDTPKTPLDRLIEAEQGDPVKIEQFKQLRIQLDPFKLSKIIDEKVERIVTLANFKQSPKETIFKKKITLPPRSPGQLSRAEMEVFDRIQKIFGIPVKMASSHG